MRICPKKKNNQSAVALLEFAIALPLLILLLTFVFEGGRYFDAYFRMASIAWDGTRFFSSLEEPEVQCFEDRMRTDLDDPDNNPHSVKTTNLAFWEAPPNNKVIQTHLPIHQRIAAEFRIKTDSWPIKSNDMPRDAAITASGIKTVWAASGKPMPTIRTQYIGSLGPGNVASDICSPPPTPEMENTVGVCLFTTYQGLFFNLPIKTCSYAYLLAKTASTFGASATATPGP